MSPTPETEESGRTLAIILARGGSLSIPRKNLRSLGGVPLVGRGIQLLQTVPEIGRIVVSTDDAEVASMALAYGAEIPFLRPPELAEAETPSLPALEHAVGELVKAGETATSVLLFQVTSPFCDSEQIRDALRSFRESEAPYLKSVTPVEEHPHWMGTIDGGRFYHLVPRDERATRRQDLPPLYRLNGAISIYRTELLLKKQAEEGLPMAFVMSVESSLDLDSPRDWELAEARFARQEQ